MAQLNDQILKTYNDQIQIIIDLSKMINDIIENINKMETLELKQIEKDNIKNYMEILIKQKVNLDNISYINEMFYNKYIKKDIVDTKDIIKKPKNIDQSIKSFSKSIINSNDIDKIVSRRRVISDSFDNI
jgi:hypothetical protein